MRVLCGARLGRLIYPHPRGCANGQRSTGRTKKEPTVAKEEPPAGDKTFTQDEVDRIVSNRLAEERKKFGDYDELKAKAGELDKLKESSASEMDKLTEQVTKLTEGQAAAEARALRAEVATAKGLTAAQAKRLAGSTREELEADADEILEAFPVSSSTESTSRGGPPSRQPKPVLRGGSDPTEEESVETDPAKLADGVPRF